MYEFTIDGKIKNICNIIDSNIQELVNSNIELLSQNIIAQLRNLIEHTAVKIYSSSDTDIDVNYDNITKALGELKAQSQLKWLRQFHDWTQASVSHYAPDGDSSYRLMLKYYAPLIKLKNLLDKKYNLRILKNFHLFPIKQDSDLQQYYEKIAEKINSIDLNGPSSSYNDRYYIQGIKPFFISGEIYYQVTFTTAHGNVSKFDRMIAFTKLDIPSNYAVKFDIKSCDIQVFNTIKMPVQIIENYEVSIRPCEIDNFAKIFDCDTRGKGDSERNQLMKYLTKTGLNLFDFMDMDDIKYEKVKTEIIKSYKSVVFDILDKCRDLIRSNKNGSNILRYLLFTMNNKVIKSQYTNQDCQKLSNLKLELGCIPFDEMPFCTSPRGHNPAIFDLLECLDNTNREHEGLARVIKNNTEIRGMLYTPEDELGHFNNVDALMACYNQKLYHKHTDRELKKHNNHICISGYEKDTKKIIESLFELCGKGMENYKQIADDYLEQNPQHIDCPEKKDILKKAFVNTNVICLYGSAGTGKTKFIEYLSDLFKAKRQVLLANTNAAVNNLKRRITLEGWQFQTITKYNNGYNKETDILIIDECSTVSNADMRKLLDTVAFEVLVLVGDIYQIESIRFGNWFGIAKKALSDHCVFEFTKPYRTTDTNLLKLWKKVREGEDGIAEHIAHYNYARNLNEKFYQSEFPEDEIILCLNYGGLYGVNNINAFLQTKNHNSSFEWGTKVYKVGDPVLFNESPRFNNIIHNNCKGKIESIQVEGNKIIFDITLELDIKENDISFSDIELLRHSENGSTIRFSVDKYKSTDDDEDGDQVPFHVAYAISIHKAQGLEYNSVKVIISEDAEEQITHNIFYTAITRTKKHLTIYWSAETQKSILERMKHASNNKDWHLLCST